MKRRIRVRPPERQRGYILIMVLACLVLLAMVAGRFAARIDIERELTALFRAEADAESLTDSALAALLYWLSAQPANSNGAGDGGPAQWIMDGRWYELGPQVRISVQDERGLASINQPDQPALRRLLEAEGLDAPTVARMLDVLADYVDTDSLKRLNGAESRDYEALNLPPPRNDYLRSIQELQQMPVWREHPDVVARLAPSISTRTTGLLNPNTAPQQLIRALLPGASDQQLALFATLRESAPFVEGWRATAATGLPLSSDEYMFHVGTEFRVRIWIDGQPRAREYNLVLDPGRLNTPWQIKSAEHVARPKISKTSRPPFESPFSVLQPPSVQR